MRTTIWVLLISAFLGGGFWLSRKARKQHYNRAGISLNEIPQYRNVNDLDTQDNGN